MLGVPAQKMRLIRWWLFHALRNFRVFMLARIFPSFSLPLHIFKNKTQKLSKMCLPGVDPSFKSKQQLKLSEVNPTKSVTGVNPDLSD